jgi:hypothetical protein
MLAFAGSLSAQGPVAQSQSVSRTIAMTVVDGTLLQIALDKEVRVRKVGEPIAGRVMQPVYVFDRLVIPVGAVAVGRISVIEPVSARRRTLDALNAEFTPYHKLAVLFDGLIFPNGRHIDLHAAIVPGSGEIIRLVTADERKRTW